MGESKLGKLHRCIYGFVLGAGIALAGCSANGGPGGAGGSSGGGGAAPVVKLTAAPSSVNPGGSFTLTWSTTGATACTASGGSGADGWAGAEPTSGSKLITASNVQGTYSYVLTCTGGGGSGVGVANVQVGNPAPPTVSISVAPSTIQPGQSATITWSTTNAESCTAGGAWSGSQPTSGTQSTGAVNTVGTYSYTLNCTGAGGSGAGSATLTVSNTPTATVSISANPTAVAVGGSATITWSTTNVTSCTASGNGPNWTGKQATNGTFNTGALNTAGVYQYTLDCSGGGAGSASGTATVTVGTPGAPTVTITANPSTIKPGQSSTLTWSSTNATACTASGSWSGSEPVAGSASTGLLTTDGVYSYTLICSGPKGSAAGTATVTVAGVAVTDDCGTGKTSTAMLTPHATAAAGTPGGLCLLCSVSQPQNVTDADLSNFATINLPITLLTGSDSLTVTNDAQFAGGTTVGFLIGDPQQVLTATLIEGISLSTLNAGVPTGDTACTAGSTLGECTNTATLPLDLLTLLRPGGTYFVSFQTTHPFDAVQITDGVALAGLISQLDVYAACTAP